MVESMHTHAHTHAHAQTHIHTHPYIHTRRKRGNHLGLGVEVGGTMVVPVLTDNSALKIMSSHSRYPVNRKTVKRDQTISYIEQMWAQGP